MISKRSFGTIECRTEDRLTWHIRLKKVLDLFPGNSNNLFSIPEAFLKVDRFQLRMCLTVLTYQSKLYFDLEPAFIIELSVNESVFCTLPLLQNIENAFSMYIVLWLICIYNIFTYLSQLLCTQSICTFDSEIWVMPMPTTSLMLLHGVTQQAWTHSRWITH